MQPANLYDLWRARATEDPDLIAELERVAGDAEAINDRFYRDLAFGTGGLRGVIGAGTNRMNIYTIRRATQGLADTLNASGLPKKVALAPRQPPQGRTCSAGRPPGCWPPTASPPTSIPGWSPPRPSPGRCGIWAAARASASRPATTPPSTTATRCNGADGCQITLEMADQVLAAIGRHDYFDSPKLADYDEAVADGRIVTIDDQCLSDFVDAVLALRPGNDVSHLKLVYTPLNGARSRAGEAAAGPHGCDQRDGSAPAGEARRGLPHLPLPQPRDPPGHGDRPEALRHPSTPT